MLSFYDLRPILNGLEWQLFDTAFLSVHELRDRFSVDCPPGFSVGIFGAPVQRFPEGEYFCVEDGQVLVVEFIADFLPNVDSSATEGDDSDESPPDSDSDSEHTSSPSEGSGSESNPPSSDSHRSRSPRALEGTGPVPRTHSAGWMGCGLGLKSWIWVVLARPFAAVSVPPTHHSPTTYLCSTKAGRVDMWPFGPIQHARSRGPPRDTSVLLAKRESSRLRTPLAVAKDTKPHLSPPVRSLLPRPLTTPCRSSRGLGSSKDALIPDNKVGPTLLEIAVQCPDNTAMLDARALLETLWEYLQPQMHAAPKQEQSTSASETAAKVLVSLNDAIQPTSFQTMAHSLAQCVPHAAGMPGTSYLCQQDWLDNDVRHLLHDAFVPAKWKRILPHIPLWHTTAACAPPLRIYIYTDGSATSSPRDIAPAAWAFTVWFQCQAPPCLPFYVGGCAHTTAPPDSEYHLGESDESALTGELLALAWATAWALEIGSTYSVPIEFRYDATSAGGGVFGTSRCPNSTKSAHGPALASFAVQLRQCLENRCLVLHQHVKGHAGHLGNEMCDLMSKHSRRHPSPPYDRMLPWWPHRWWAHPLWEWGWMAGLDSPAYPSLSALEAEASRLQAREIHPTVPSIGQQAKTYRRAEVTYHIAVASYNVLTLFDPSAPKGRQARRGQTGLLTMGKRDVLKAQFLAKGLWLVGLQETRLPDTATLPDKDFWMFSSGATAQGQGGCSLWVSKRHPYAREKHGEHRIRAGEIVITSRSERHLQAHIEAPRLSLTVLVAHAPKAENGDDSLARAFWREREQELLRRPARADFIILADANSHLGSHNTSAVGTAGAETENLEGTCFHASLHRVNGLLPSTFTEMHSGSHWTWYAPGPQPVKHRIDYIVIPVAWGMLGPQSWVWESFEALQARQDHLPVCLRMSFAKHAPPTCHMISHRHAVRPSRNLDVQTRLGFGLQMLAMPTRPWEEDVDVHYTQWSRQIKELAQQLNAPASRQPTNSYLSADTMVIVDRRAALRLYLKQETAERERRLKMIAYAALILHTRGAVSTEAAQRRAALWLKDLDYSIAQAIERLNEQTVAIKAAVRRDRLVYLQGLVQEVTLQDLRQPKALFAAVRKAFPFSRSRLSLRQMGSWPRLLKRGCRDGPSTFKSRRAGSKSRMSSTFRYLPALPSQSARTGLFLTSRRCQRWQS